jgi:hypothetical protein
MFRARLLAGKSLALLHGRFDRALRARLTNIYNLSYMSPCPNRSVQ